MANDPLAALRASEAQQRASQTEAALAAAPNGQVIPTADPSGSNDQWLANSINELREKDTAYAKLNSEQARRDWEDMTRTNLIRQRESQERIAARAEAEQINVQQRDDLHDTRLLKHVDELNAVLPNSTTEWSLPLDQLRDVAKTAQELDMMQRRRKIGPYAPEGQQPAKPQNERPDTFSDGSLYKLTNLPDGNMEVELITGERFTGDPVTVTRLLAESKVHTTKWGKEQKQLAQAAQQKLAQGVQQQPQNGQEGQDQGFSPDFGTWAADEQARALGFSDRNEMVQWGLEMSSFKSKMEDQLTATEFLAQHPDYPNSEAANAALTQVIDKLFNGNWNPETMGAAHAYAVQSKLYSPLTPDQINQQWADSIPNNRRTPPPMVRGNNPESQYSRNNDPYSMPLKDLRSAAIQQELEGARR